MQLVGVFNRIEGCESGFMLTENVYLLLDANQADADGFLPYKIVRQLLSSIVLNEGNWARCL